MIRYSIFRFEKIKTPQPKSLKDEFEDQDLLPLLKKNPKAVEKFIYQLEKEYLPTWCSERDFIKDLIRLNEDEEGFEMELKLNSRLISQGIYPKYYFWMFDNVNGGLYYSGRGD